MRGSFLPSLFSLSLSLSLYLTLLAPQNSNAVLAQASSGHQHTFNAAQDDARQQYDASSSSSQHLTSDQLLTRANAALSAGKYHDALNAFDAALEADPSSWLTYYRRATAQLSLGRTTNALKDFDSLLELNPNFEKAFLKKAEIYAKEGDVQRAKAELKSWKQLSNQKPQKNGPDQTTAARLEEKIDRTIKNLKSLEKVSSQIAKAKAKAKSTKPRDPNWTKEKAIEQKLQECVALGTEILEVAPNNLDIRRIKADCLMLKGDLDGAIADWSRIAHLSPSPTLLHRLSSLSYFIVGTPDSQSREAGMAHLKACLHSDPDNKKCARAHKRLRNIEKALKKARNFANSESYRAVLSALKGGKVGGNASIIQDVEKAIEEDLKVVEVEGEEQSVLPEGLDPEIIKRSALLLELNGLYCKAHAELNELDKAMAYCEKVLEVDAENVDANVAKAEVMMKEEKYEEAVRTLEGAFERSGRTDRKIHQKLATAQKRLKLSKSKDYYKVLGVKRDDDLATIKKAYRKMARKVHPDKGGTQEQMAAVNEAWGVLGDEELRRRYDMGDDPNDPAGQGGGQGSYGNPFAQGGGGGHPFAHFFQQAGGFPGGGFPGGGFPGGGGQQFHFKFG
ncbi:TPR-like protein [Violaceomyces palustris]|uniref:TPR-like protein n=1 Tax=Violaceomyces palustris TaxID=1673888 RepID=A0ACD0NV74_9BASI|nr:TPR-like protein [Violaceomyces palustris]